MKRFCLLICRIYVEVQTVWEEKSYLKSLFWIKCKIFLFTSFLIVRRLVSLLEIKYNLKLSHEPIKNNKVRFCIIFLE